MFSTTSPFWTGLLAYLPKDSRTDTIARSYDWLRGCRGPQSGILNSEQLEVTEAQGILRSRSYQAPGTGQRKRCNRLSHVRLIEPVLICIKGIREAIS